MFIIPGNGVLFDFIIFLLGIELFDDVLVTLPNMGTVNTRTVSILHICICNDQVLLLST